MKARIIKFRLAGGLITVLGVYLMIIGYGQTWSLSIATVVLIFGIAIWMMATPKDYNQMTDMGAMIEMEKPRTIEEFYEAYKNVWTPLGSAWLGKFYTMKQTALVFGPDARGQYIYFWIQKNGAIGYIGYSFIEHFIKKQVTTPLIPMPEDTSLSIAGHLSYHSDLLMFQSELRENIERFIKTGQVLQFSQTKPSQIYTFTEEFKLTGQHFDLEDSEGNLVYEIDSTVPLKTFRIYDTSHNEVFRMTKELIHVLATYRFYLYGEPYGVLKEKFALVRDKFAMELPEGKLEMSEYAGSIGHNYKVTLNGRMIGAIMDNMDITVGNVFFDNAFLIIYDTRYLPQMAALAVMAARELARDRDGGLSNR